MRELFKELLSMVESEVTWLEGAARHYESFGGRDAEKPTWDLLAAVYRERALIHQALAEKLRSQGQLPQPEFAALSRHQRTDMPEQGTTVAF